MSDTRDSKRDEEGRPSSEEIEEDPVGRRPPSSGTRYSAREIHDTVLKSARDEMGRPWRALWWSAIAAGLLISFSFLASSFLSQLAHDEKARDALTAAGYPLGFIFVVLSSTQLFTENTLDPILPLLDEPTAKTAGRVARLWGLLLAGNLVGAFVMGEVIAQTPVAATSQDALVKTALSATQGSFRITFFLAIFGGWLIALMAWLINTTPSRLAQIVLIWLTTAPISAFGFRHSIAGSVEAFFLAARGTTGWGQIAGQFIVPAVLGNAVGGALLVALLFYGQVRSDKQASHQAQARAGPTK